MSEISSFTTQKGDVRPFVLLRDLPMPPTSNSQYTIARGRFIPAKGLKQYKAAMMAWAFKEAANTRVDRRIISEWLGQGLALECRAVFFFYRKNLFTKKQMPKRIDVSNRIKACHDEVAKILGIDDSLFFKISAEKAVCHDNLQETCCIEVVPTLV